MKITIAGLGLMGASLAMALKQNINDIEILGYDLPEVLADAENLGIIDRRIKTWPDDCEASDIIFLATPLSIIKKHLLDLVEVVSADTIVTDLGSTKEQLDKFTEKINFPGIYIGGHPMTGAEKSGLKAGNPLLYENAVYILTDPHAESNPVIREKLLPILNAIKARVLLLAPDVHDKILSVISHLPQILAIALVNLVGEKKSADLPYFELAAGGFRDLTRIASGSINIWQDIIASNKDYISEAIDGIDAILKKMQKNLSDLSSDFLSANNLRSQLPVKSKGFISPLTDVLVYVNDQVGVVAKISNSLANKEIDIRDIELLKIREKEGGVFRLSFSNREEAEQAIQILKSIDYRAYIRE
jgi:prephenate dehydrogenase